MSAHEPIDPSDPSSPGRRTVLRWLAALPGVAAIGLQAGCSDTGSGLGSDAGSSEEGGGDPDISSSDTLPEGDAPAPESDSDGPEIDTGERGETDTNDESDAGGRGEADSSESLDTADPPDVVADAAEPPSDVEIPPEPPAPDPCVVTGSDVLGPFHEAGAPMSTVIAGPDEPGERIRIDGRVYGPGCDAPLAGALLDVWQADAVGGYHDANAGVYRLRGQMLTDDEGRYSFVSILPGNYELGVGQWRPAHIHFNVSSPGLTPLTTQLYFEGDPYLPPNDACGSCNSGDPTHVVPLVEETGEDGESVQAGFFDIVLGGNS
jgi:protocatechuate 3,4-dioxygenase beta subunit